MRKLRLDLDELAVETFETAADARERGTVRARCDESLSNDFFTDNDIECYTNTPTVAECTCYLDVCCPTYAETCPDTCQLTCRETCGRSCWGTCDYTCRCPIYQE
jgi:hypothetical protein